MLGKKPSEIATIDIAGRKNGRRLALVSKILAEAQIDHQATLSFLHRIKLGDLEKRNLAQAGAEIVTPFSLQQKALPLLITDQANPTLKARKIIHICYDLSAGLGRSLRNDEVFFPISFHPDQISLATEEKALELSENRKRPIRLLFAGSCKAKTYNNPRINEKFGLLNRLEIYALVRELPNTMVSFPQNLEQLEVMLRDASGQHKKLVWIDTNQFKIPPEHWFKLLAKTDGFLCTPGANYPWCQNLNEAMACGTIPLLQYPHLYNPALSHQENAIAFSDETDFKQNIVAFLQMEATQIATMRNSALTYYQQFLSLKRIISAIKTFLNDPDRTEMTWYLAGRSYT